MTSTCPSFRSRHFTLSAATALSLCSLTVHAGTVASTFSFQQGDLRQDGTLYGLGASYAGALDGSIQDNAAASAVSTGAAATIGNQFQSGSPNGRNHVGLFSYDLTELNDFITTNTTATSSATVTSVSFKLIASGNTSGTANSTIFLYRTDPFTSGSTWSTTNGSTAWSSPYQNLAAPNNTAQFGYTGGGSALTANLGGASPGTGGKSAGSPLEWTTSANFVAALDDALARPDKTLYLMAARGLQNSDGRVPVNSSNATTVDNRPELVVTVAVSTLSDWTGASSTSWATAGNWTSLPGVGDNVRFNSSSNTNLDTVLDVDFDLNGLALIDPTGPVSIGGANTLTLGVGGLDLSAATQNLTITAPLVLSAPQIWNVNTGRTVSVGGAVTGSGDLTLFGAGKVSLAASNILPNGASAGNLIVSATLDLNGTSQSVNALTGAGIVDNAGGGTSTLTIGNNNAGGVFNGTLQETSGILTVAKVGNGGLTLNSANGFSGGFTNNGSGNVSPNNNLAFGTGPVVSNAGTIYATATTTFANTLELNNSILRIGGGNNRTITWNGAVTATGTSGLSADGGTGGITLGSTLEIAGATFNSYANGGVNNIIGDISAAGGALNVTGGTLNIDGNIGGAGSAIGLTAGTLNINGNISGAGSAISLTGGTLQLAGTGTYTGTTTLSGSSVFRLQPTGTISNSTNVVVNSSGNFNIRNTVGWVYSGTITGDGSGSININSGTDATLAGGISGVANINVGSSGTAAAISGVISGATNVNVQSTGASLSLSGNNDYTGGTSITGGSLVLAASNVLPDATDLTIGNAALDAATFTDTAGTLNLTGTATINLGTDAALVFADSSGVGSGFWGGTLSLTGTFVSGVSLKFGTSDAGLTDDQLAVISAAGFTGFDLDANGFLIASAAGGYSTWALTNAPSGTPSQDSDGDGVSNAVEYVLGGTALTNDLGKLPTVSSAGGNLVFTFQRAQSSSDALTQIELGSTLAAWTIYTVLANTEVQEAGVTVENNLANPGFDTVTLTVAQALGPKQFARLKVTP